MTAGGYFREGDETHGPFEPQQLRQLVQTGRIKRSTLVRRGDEGPWYEAERIKGLFADPHSTLPEAASDGVKNPESSSNFEVSNSSVIANSRSTHRAARCPDCGASLTTSQVQNDHAKCTFCGATLIRDAPKSLLTPVQDQQPEVSTWLRLASAAERAGNYQEAYGYYTSILERDPSNVAAWYGKTMMAGWQSTLQNSRFMEMTSGLTETNSLISEHGYAGLGVESLDEFRQRVADDLQDLANAYFSTAYQHFREYISLDSAWIDYVNHCQQTQQVLELATKYSPNDIRPLLRLVDIVTGLIEGYQYNDEYNNFVGTARRLPREMDAEFSAKRDDYVAAIKQLSPSYNPAPIQKVGCFIATAVTGASDSKPVETLRRFRDVVLMANPSGQRIAAFYYRHSPPLADVIARSAILRLLAAITLVFPAYWVARFSLRDKRSD